MSNRLKAAAASDVNMNNMIDAIKHINWTIDHSAKTYFMLREKLISLRQNLVNEELRHQAITGEKYGKH